ncbi:hypothetical protein V6C27_14240 [Peptococcaceae bacterium 1198_IL3148]
MKKLIIVLITCIFMFGIGGSAMAAENVNKVDLITSSALLEQTTLDYLETDSYGTQNFDVKDIKKFANEAGVSDEFAKYYVNSAKELLKQIQDQGLSVDMNTGYIIGEDKQLNATGEGTYEVGPLHWKTYFGSAKTEKMIDNLNRQADIFTGLSLVGFKYSTLGVILALCAWDSDYQADEIYSNYKRSGWNGVVFEEIHTPLSGPPIEHWIPWYN